MKEIKLIPGIRIPVVLTLGIIITLFFYSCNKEDSQTNNPSGNSLASKVIGTYSGVLKNSNTNQSVQATLTTTISNDSLVSIHCIAPGFDSTVVVQLYQNYDSIMVCYTGQNFYNAYGHNKNNYDFCYSKQSGWMNNNWRNNASCWGNNMITWGNSSWAGNDQWNAWTNHMNTQHNQNDVHPGEFYPTSKSCHYEFFVQTGNTHYFEVFDGMMI